MIKRIFVVIAAFIVGLAACGCSRDEDKIKNEYEAPVRTMLMAIQKKDCESYLRCFATPVVEDYKQSELYNDKLAEDINSYISETVGNAATLNFKVESKAELTGEELAQLCSDIRNGIEIKTAYRLETEIVASDFKQSKSCYLTLTVGKIGSNWYICQYPELELKF